MRYVRLFIYMEVLDGDSEKKWLWRQRSQTPGGNYMLGISVVFTCKRDAYDLYQNRTI